MIFTRNASTPKTFFIAFATFIVWANLFFAAQTTSAQNYTVQLYGLDTDSISLKKLTTKTRFVLKDSTEQAASLPKIIDQLHQKGYLSASVDSVQRNLKQLNAYLWVGQKYHIDSLKINNIDPKWLNKVQFKPQNFNNQPLQWQSIQQIQQKLLVYAENNGYPFAKIALINTQINPNNGVNTTLQLDKQQYITFDTIAVLGNVRISKPFLYRYLGIKTNKPYNENTIKQVQKRLNELTFLQQDKTPTIDFIANQARLNLWLKRKKASRFDVLLGVIPKTETGSTVTTQTKYEITGEGNLNLQNSLGSAETIDVAFRSYQNKSRQLKARVIYPYLPVLPLGADVAFELFIRDTTHRDVSTLLAAQYLLQGNNYVKAFWQTKASTILSLDSLTVATTRKLPALLDFKNQQYGLEYQLEHLDYRFNPRKGIAIWLNTSIGLRKIQTNTRILSIGDAINTNFAAQYDSLQQNPIQWQIQYKLSKYTPLGKRTTLKTELQGALIQSNLLLANEVYRIGGNRLLRGFDEQSIFATQYHLLSIEYRLLVGGATTFFVFGDIAYTQNNVNNTNTNSLPIGTGIGLTLETKAGVFGLSYAIGKLPENPFNLRSAKIHFGYVNYF